jgi:transposase-like protein
MIVTVSLTVELEARAPLGQLETRIRQAGQEAMKQTMKQAIHAQEEKRQCPGCGSENAASKGSKPRVVLTSFGRVELSLRRYRCADCGARYRPADSVLQEVKGHNY